MTKTSATASQKVYDADTLRFEKYFTEVGAICTGTDSDGTEFLYLDESKASAQMLSSYKRFMLYGYANGLAA